MKTLLFFDDWWLLKRQNMERRLGEPEWVPEAVLEDNISDATWNNPFVFRDEQTSRWIGLYAGHYYPKPGVRASSGLNIAESEDGIHWRLSKRPLLGNTPGSRGPFSSILVRLWGRWLLLFGDHRGLSGALSEGSDVTGPYEDAGCLLESGGWPFPVFHEGKLYLLCAGINAYVIEW